LNKEELKERTKLFGLRIIKLVDVLPNTMAGWALGKQLIRAGTSVGANYRAACRGRSKKEFAVRLGVVLEEADESSYWLELIMDGELLPRPQVESLHQEADELAAIFFTTIRTTKNAKC